MSRVVTAPIADQDIDHLAEDTAKRFGRAAGERFLDDFYRTAGLLAEHPYMCRQREDVGPGVRSFPLGPLVVFYQTLDPRPAESLASPRAGWAASTSVTSDHRPRGSTGDAGNWYGAGAGTEVEQWMVRAAR